jgi:hypothetical protein
MQLPLSVNKIIPKAIGHLGVDQIKSPLMKFEEGYKVNRNAVYIGFN